MRRLAFAALVISTPALAGWGDPEPRGWEHVETGALDAYVNRISREDATGTVIGRYSECREADKGIQCQLGGPGGTSILVAGKPGQPPRVVDISGDNSPNTDEAIAVLAVFSLILRATDPDNAADVLGEITRRMARRAENGSLSTDAARYEVISGELGCCAVYIEPLAGQ